MKNKKIKSAVILAGGLGTRFLPATAGVAKEMFPLLDKPLLFYHLQECAQSGIQQVVIVSNKNKSEINKFINPRKKLIKHLSCNGKLHLLDEYFSVLNKLKIKIVYQKRQNGTGGALLKAKKYLKDNPFILINGDDLFDCKVSLTKQLIDIHYSTGKNVCVIKDVGETQISKYGCAKFTQKSKNYYKLQQIIEKPEPKDAPSTFAVLGRYALNYNIFKKLKNIPRHNGEYYTTDAINLLAKEKQCVAIMLCGEYLDCGNKLEFAKCYVNSILKTQEYGSNFAKFLKDLVKEL